MSLFSRMRGFIKSQSGNVAIMFAMSSFGMVTMAGVAMDYTAASGARTSLASAADSAALAGATTRGSASAREAVARAAFETNLLRAGLDGTITPNFIPIEENGKITGYRVDVSSSIRTRFGGLTGRGNIGVELRAEVRLATNTPLDISFVLDTTGSMAGARLDGLKSAVNGILDEIVASEFAAGMIRIGIVPFAEYVNVGTGNRYASWIDVPDIGSLELTNPWNGCVGSRAAPYDTRDGDYAVRVPGVRDVQCGLPILNLTTDITAVRSRVSALGAAGNTYLPAGLMWGWRQLSANDPLPAGLNDGRTPKKFMIFVSDGRNTLSANSGLHNGRDTIAADAKTAEVCQSVASDAASGVRIFPIAFEMDGLDAKLILQNCASRTGGEFFDAANSVQLREAMSKILFRIMKVALTH